MPESRKESTREVDGLDLLARIRLLTRAEFEAMRPDARYEYLRATWDGREAFRLVALAQHDDRGAVDPESGYSASELADELALARADAKRAWAFADANKAELDRVLDHQRGAVGGSDA